LPNKEEVEDRRLYKDFQNLTRLIFYLFFFASAPNIGEKKENLFAVLFDLT
jgi:hypothetical protein